MRGDLEIQTHPQASLSMSFSSMPYRALNVAGSTRQNRGRSVSQNIQVLTPSIYPHTAQSCTNLLQEFLKPE